MPMPRDLSSFIYQKPLEKIPLFRQMEPAALAALCQHMKLVTYMVK